MRDRVHQFVADGVDLIVATDHNVIANYAPLVAELGVTDLLATATGDEITTKSWGHFGAFPLPSEEGELGHGAISVGKRTPTEIFGDIRKRFFRNKLAVIGLGMVAFVFLVALLAPVIAPHDPYEQNLSATTQPPSGLSTSRITSVFR